jgi:NitT/TauT family transport system permease protein
MIDATPETATTTLSVPRATRARRTTVRTEKPLTLLYLSTLVLGIAVWWIIAVVSDNPLAPTPIAVVQSFWEGLLDGSLLLNTVASVQRVVIGFLLGVIVAVPAGFIMGWVQFFRTVPPLALIPLVIVFLGIGEPAKIFVIFLASFLSCVLATFQGVRNVDTTLVNAARVLGASDGTIFLRVVVPASLPFIFVGTRVALGAAWATVVASELIAAAFGLGRMMQAASQFLDTPRIVVGIILIGALGFAMDRALLFAENKLTAWQEVRK